MERKQYLECAKIVGTHGVRGTVRLECRCDSPQALRRIPRMYYTDRAGIRHTLTVSHASVQKNMVLATFSEITTLEDAIPLRDTVLEANRADIPRAPGSHFIADLISLPVIDADSGASLGVLDEVLSPAGRDVYVVRKPDGQTFMIPAVPAFVLRITEEDTDTEPAGIYVRLIEGMMD